LVFSGIAHLVVETNRRLADRGSALRVEFSGRHLVLRGPETLEPAALVEAGAAVFAVRAAAAGLGIRIDVDRGPGGVPTVWATLFVHPRTSGGEHTDVLWPGGPRVPGSERTARSLSARELVAACERGAASEGVSVRVAPLPLPDHVGLVLRANGEESTAWFALGQAWAGIERLARRGGWVAHRRPRSTAPLAAPANPWFSAQVEVWVLRRPAQATGPTTLSSDEWTGL
jgi:hypothetical protein